MSDLTAQQCEEYVRSRWNHVTFEDYGGYTIWTSGIAVKDLANGQRDWAEAYAFTVELERQIAQVTYEISLQHLILDNHRNSEWKNTHDHEEEALKRTIIRLQSVRDELKRGMK